MGAFDTLKIDNFALTSGVVLPEVKIAYATFGEPNSDRSNAILIFHALTGDQFVTGINHETLRRGWWSHVVGATSGHPINTQKFFVVCCNVLGGCMGSTGPASIDELGEVYGAAFPFITMEDMVRAQSHVISHLQIDCLAAVIGPSAGGMQALQWCAIYPHRTKRAILIGTAARECAKNIAIHEAARQAIMSDPNWWGGNYLRIGAKPTHGLAVARMIAHISYLTRSYLENKFSRRRADESEIFEIESYLRSQGSKFANRFDANSYIVLTRAIDAFDLTSNGIVPLEIALNKCNIKYGLICFSTDELQPPSESRAIAEAVVRGGGQARLVEIDSESGHDSFLMDSDALKTAILSLFEDGEP